MNIRWLSIASGVALMLALLPTWPYEYYILLRWGIFTTSIIVAIGFYKSKLTGWSVVFSVIAYLFNPIIPVYLTRTLWAPIDLISAILFFLAGFSFNRK